MCLSVLIISTPTFMLLVEQCISSSPSHMLTSVCFLTDIKENLRAALIGISMMGNEVEQFVKYLLTISILFIFSSDFIGPFIVWTIFMFNFLQYFMYSI